MSEPCQGLNCQHWSENHGCTKPTVSALTARLAAIGVTLDEVDEYEPAWFQFEGQPVPWVRKDQADAALAAVVGELERERTEAWRLQLEYSKSLSRAEKAEDQRMQLKADIDVLKTLLERAESETVVWKDAAKQAELARAEDKLEAEAEAENARLRETNKRLNRRAQLAEAAANERLKDGPRGFGQMLTLLRCRQLEEEMAIARACAACNTHGACSTPWPCEEATECPAVKA